MLSRGERVSWSTKVVSTSEKFGKRWSRAQSLSYLPTNVPRDPKINKTKAFSSNNVEDQMEMMNKKNVGSENHVYINNFIE